MDTLKTQAKRLQWRQEILVPSQGMEWTVLRYLPRTWIKGKVSAAQDQGMCVKMATSTFDVCICRKTRLYLVVWCA